jgi:hypothetical protein
MNFLQSLFRPKTISEIKQRLAAEAERYAIEHRCSAEHHRALSDMYVARARALRRDLSQ